MIFYVGVQRLERLKGIAVGAAVVHQPPEERLRVPQVVVAGGDRQPASAALLRQPRFDPRSLHVGLGCEPAPVHQGVDTVEADANVLGAVVPVGQRLLTRPL